jgi:GntR family transcriptional regulator, transcriptional repressor for pyruvate dehydrogenase complex
MSSPPPRVKRGKKVGEVVAREILKDALRRELPPGSRLPPEGEMIEQLQVGRGSLREGLRILEVQGLLVIRPGPGGGPVLAEASSRGFGSMSTLFFMAQGSTYREVIEGRLALFPLMARLAAEHPSPDAAERLQAAIDDTHAALDADDRSWQLTATQFYPTVAAVAGNKVLSIMATSLQDIYMYHLPTMKFSVEHRNSVAALHGRIAKAILRGDARTAERMMRARMDEFRQQVSELFPSFLDEVVDWD